MRTIDADALKDEIRQDLMKYACMIPPVAAIRAVDCVIDKQPTIEPRAKSKWWHYEGILQCCNCSAEFYDDIVEYTGDDVPKFCPNCGADMREVTE